MKHKTITCHGNGAILEVVFKRIQNHFVNAQRALQFSGGAPQGVTFDRLGVTFDRLGVTFDRLGAPQQVTK